MSVQSILFIGPSTRRDSIQKLLRRHPQLELVGELTTATSLRLSAQLAPDIIILDCTAPQINPLVVLPEIAALPNAPHIIALGATNTVSERRLLRSLGASTYASLDQHESLIEALTLISAQHLPSSPSRPAVRQYTRRAAGLPYRHAGHV